VTAAPSLVGVPEHVLDEKYSYWTVPPAFEVAPVREALSVTGCPVGTLVAESVVVMVGVAWLTVSWKVPELPTLLMSPE